MQSSIYEAVAQSFLDDHPVGTVVTGHKLMEWVAAHPDGEAIKPDLAISDPGKRLNALRRHLNEGGRSEAVAEDRRFQLQVQDSKRKTYRIRLHAEIIEEQARQAVGKSVVGALSPLRRSQRALDAVKIDELPEIDRQAHELARENLEAMERAVKPTMQQEVDRIWVSEMTRRGISAGDALKIRAALPQVTQLQKLLRATS